MEASLHVHSRGKTTFVTRLLRHASTMIEAPPEKTTWCYGEWQNAYATMNLSDLQFEEGLPNASSFDPATKNLEVIDDLMAETDGRVTNLFTRKSHHRNTSVLYLVQNLFPKRDHQSERSLYDDVQESHRQVADIAFGATDLPGSLYTYNTILCL